MNVVALLAAAAQQVGNEGDIFQTFRQHIVGVAVAAGGLLLAAVREYLLRAKLKLLKRENERAGERFLLPVQHPPGDKNRRTSVMLLGIGGVGKTTLIQKLIGHDEARPNERTKSYSLYHVAHRSNKDKYTYHFRLVRQICGSAPAPGGGRACERARS